MCSSVGFVAGPTLIPDMQTFAQVLVGHRPAPPFVALKLATHAVVVSENLPSICDAIRIVLGALYLYNYIVHTYMPKLALSRPDRFCQYRLATHTLIIQ
jgi:hypothetical protein